MGSHFLFTTVYVPPKLVLYLESCAYITLLTKVNLINSVGSSNSHPDLLLTHQPLFQITPVLDTGLSLSEPLQLYKGYNAI